MNSDRAEMMPSKLSVALQRGEISALSRAITLAEAGGPRARELLAELSSPEPEPKIIGFTGAPGVGKSTLISAYVRELRNAGQRIAVLSVDPSSPISGGAFLGDRLRMTEHAGDPGVFVRSLASRAHLGGLCENIQDILRVVVSAGVWEAIILETVGAGQSEVEIARIADCKVVVVMPGQGDDIQAMKAGILEIADVLVVNKADLPGADHTIKDLRAMLRLRQEARANVPVVKTIATAVTGASELAEVISEACK